MQNKADYWLELCNDDLRAARNLLASKDFLWMGFICHLIAEKALKAAISSFFDEIPPRTHHLLKLADKAGVYADLNDRQRVLLAKLIPLQIEARYPENKTKIAETLTEDYCIKLLEETEDFLCWIKAKLEK